MAWSAPTFKPKGKVENRPNANARGYTHQWAKFRLLYLAQHPLCVQCAEAATDVDHVTPLAQGGAKYDEHNLRALCHKCHSLITLNYRRTGVNESMGD